MIKSEMKVTIHNRFDAVLTNTKTGEEKRYVAFNMVLDNWFNYLRRNTKSSTNAANITSLVVGTGTGTLARTRTNLFNRLGGVDLTNLSIDVLSHTRFQRKATVTFSESQVNGNLTEVGLAASTGAGTLCSHAFFTDGEGNPIVIEKTNTDRLTVNVTVYAEYTITGPLKRTGCIPNGYDISSRLDYDSEVGGSRTTAFIVMDMSTWLLGTSPALWQGTSTTIGEPTYYTTRIPSRYDFSVGFHPGNNYGQASQSGSLLRFALSQNIASTVGNLAATYQIKSIGYRELFYIQFPDENIFPKKQLTFELTGDGTTTDFNLGVPELMTSNVEVSIDGVVQDPSTYNFWGIDCTMMQGIPSAQLEYLYYIDRQTPSGASAKSVPFVPGRVNQANTTEYRYDFETAITIDTLSAYRTTTLSYSSDSENWTVAASFTQTSGSTPHVETFSPISARYWKLVTAVYDGGSDTSNRGIVLGFFLNKPQLEFQTAPAQNALIEVKAYTEYPLKNDKWIIDGTSVDITITRGD